MAPASTEVVETEAELAELEAATAVEEANTAVGETEAVNDPNSPHPSAVAPALLAIVGAVLESADPIDAVWLAPIPTSLPVRPLLIPPVLNCSASRTERSGHS